MESKSLALIAMEILFCSKAEKKIAMESRKLLLKKYTKLNNY